MVLGRYTGSGHKTITLSGKVGSQMREFVHEINFPAHTGDDRSFVEGLWARRKVGYLLGEIRRVHLDRAGKLLRETNLDIPDVAEQSGFASHVRFSTVFREHLGTTPTVYRRQYRAGLA